MKNVFVISLFAALLFTFSCNTNEEDISPKIERKYISVYEDPVMKELQSSILYSSTNGKIQAQSINWNNIYRVYDPSKDITTYSLFKQANNKNEFDNMIVVKQDQKQYSYTIRYKPNLNWLAGRELTDHLEKYTGSVAFYASNGELLSEVEYENGISLLRKNKANARVEYCETVYEIHWTEAETEGGTVTGENITIYEWEVCYNDSDGSLSNSDNELDGGPSSGGGGLTPIGGGNPAVNDNEECEEGYITGVDGECIPARYHDDEAFKLCGNALNFQHVANSFTAEISGLGISVWDRYLPRGPVVNAELGLTCIQMPEYNIGTANEAGVYFAEMFNYARDKIYYLVNTGQLPLNFISIKTKLKQIITEELNQFFPGSTFSTGPCSGSIPTTVADYSC